VNAVALAILPDALDDRDFVEQYTAEVRRSRAILEQELGNLGLHYWPSHANFVLVRIGSAHAEFVHALRTRQILVRDRHSDPGCEGCVRLSVGTEKDTRRLIAVLPEVLEELGLKHEVRA
jgi:histidinol-phosphate aminotransferase